MITEIKLKNFKGHQSTQLSLDDSRLHALVGKNSSGKTSILQALYYFNMLVKSSFRMVFNKGRSPEFILKSGQQEMSVLLKYSLGNSKFINAGYGFKNQSDHSYNYKRWEAKIYFKEGFFVNSSMESVSWELSVSRFELIPKDLKYIFYVKLVSGNLSKAEYSEDITPQVQFNGSGLAPTLDYIRNEYPERFQELQKMLKKIVPGVRKIKIQRAKVKVSHQRSISIDGKTIAYDENQERIGQEIIFDMNTGDRIPAHAVSEGTILALGLLTVLMNPNQPKLVLLDDIEQGLHPRAQRELIAIFKEIIQINPDLQIIFTTHSPYILDDLNFSQVHVFNNTPSGLIFCKRLDEHPDAEWAKQTLTTGEFWDAEEESWVTTGEKSA